VLKLYDKQSLYLAGAFFIHGLKTLIIIITFSIMLVTYKSNTLLLLVIFFIKVTSYITTYFKK